MTRKNAATDYELFQQRFFFALVRWMNIVVVVALLVTSFWARANVTATLLRTVSGLLMILTGAACLYLARRGKLRMALPIYLLSAMVLLASLLLAVGDSYIFNVVLALCLLIVIAAFLDRPEHALRWTGIAIALFVIGLTIRFLVPSWEMAYSTADTVSLYLFSITFMGIFASLGFTLSTRLRRALTQGEMARVELQRTNRDLLEARSSLEAANERLHQDLKERKRIELELQANQEELQTLLHEKEVLLQEVHHRVKNNLQVISSLLDMQSYHAGNPVAVGALQESQSRVKTIALVHERLYQSPDLATVDARPYIRSIADQLMGLYADAATCIDMIVEVDDISLNPSTAIPCGLIANELISNALQHAFQDLGEDCGEIHVALRAQPDGKLSLTVSDTGVGLPTSMTPDTDKSLGLRLVRMLTQDLGGTAELQSGAGTTFTIAFDPQSVQAAEAGLR